MGLCERGGRRLWCCEDVPPLKQQLLKQTGQISWLHCGLACTRDRTKERKENERKKDKRRRKKKKKKAELGMRVITNLLTTIQGQVYYRTYSCEAYDLQRWRSSIVRHLTTTTTLVVDEKEEY